MKKIIGYVISWSFFWLGDLISRLMDICDLGLFYPAYNRLMHWSIDIQEWSGCKGPWKRTSTKVKK